MIKRIAIIGVGLLGSAVASRLLAGGFAVSGWDSRPDQLSALRPRGLKSAASLKDAVTGAEAVFTILPSLETVEGVILGRNINKRVRELGIEVVMIRRPHLAHLGSVSSLEEAVRLCRRCLEC